MEIWPFADCINHPEVAGAFQGLVHHLCSGRKGGPWCPWAVQALQENRFWCGDGRKLGTGRFEVMVDALADTFAIHFAAPITENRPVHAEVDCLTILLSDEIEYDDAENILQRKRADLLAQGMMIALLHPRSTHRALSAGPSGVPYRTRDPFLTIRRAVPEDVLFVGVNAGLRKLLDAWIRKSKLHMEHNE